MKKKLMIILLIVIIVIIGKILFSKSNNENIDINNFEDELFNEDTNKTELENKQENVVKGSGKLTSFNIEEIDTSFWTKIDEIYVKNEEMVKENQKLLKVSNSEATGIISSTISGRFFIEENILKNNYLIYDLDKVGIEIEIDELESVKLKIGQKAKVTFKAFDGEYEGKVCYISKIPNDGIIKVKVKLDFNEKFKLGCTGNIDILLDEPIDQSVEQFDIKNSIKKSGKTKITLKEQNITNSFDVIEEMLPEPQIFEKIEFDLEENNYDEKLDIDTDELSMYYSDLWNEYWNKYWKTYYEEYQTFEVLEPVDE